MCNLSQTCEKQMLSCRQGTASTPDNGIRQGVDLSVGHGTPQIDQNVQGAELTFFCPIASIAALGLAAAFHFSRKVM